MCPSSQNGIPSKEQTKPELLHKLLKAGTVANRLLLNDTHIKLFRKPNTVFPQTKKKKKEDHQKGKENASVDTCLSTLGPPSKTPIMVMKIITMSFNTCQEMS